MTIKIFKKRTELDWKDLEIYLNRENYIQFLILMVGISIGLLLLGIFFSNSQIEQFFFSQNQIIFYIFFILTRMGSPYAFFIYFIIIYHLYDKKIAKQVFLVTILAFFLSQFLKNFFHILRPISNIVADKPIQAGFGFPSGYTITTIVFWGYIFFKLRKIRDSKEKIWIQIFSILLIIIIPISRIIIGVNYFEDIIAGYIVGLTLLSLAILGEAIFHSFHFTLKTQTIIELGASLILWIGGALFLTLIYPPLGFIRNIQDLGLPIGILASSIVVFAVDQKYNHSDQGKGVLLEYNHKKIWIVVLILANIGLYSALYAIFTFIPDFIINDGVRYGLLVISATFLFPLLNKIVRSIPMKTKNKKERNNAKNH